MTSRKTFQITDLNNEQIKELQKTVREKGNKVQQATIINLAIELFFRHKQDDDYQELIEIMKVEHIL